MVLDESLHPKTASEKSLNLLKDHTPFDEFSLGGLFEKFGNGSGTRILIWNFAKDRVTGEDALRWIESDIVICSNSSSRPDCSLTSFLKFLYRESTMNISIQGLYVLNFSWENSLTRKETMDDLVMGSQIQVTFGFSETDCVENNCGVLIYWNGRLIEAHKKVGNMQSGCSRGVIGAVEVSHFMPKQNIHILQSKQQFRHCYAYDQLEESLERSYNNYAARNLTPEEMNNTPTRSDDPLFEWVHCDKCGKWRRLHPSVDKNYLPKNWFCPDFPYLGSCKEKEEKEVDGEYMIQIDDPMPR
ncbi:MORC family CW-type zinc finger protein 4-like [Papaver somniferum]|nr:MORC family CW-type zinc finger protein 4-like [Papaver somniferum]